MVTIPTTGPCESDDSQGPVFFPLVFYAPGTYRDAMTDTSSPTATELFDLSDQQLRARASMKWSNVDADVIPAWVAEMDVNLAPAIVETLQNALARHDTGYPATDAGVSTAFVGFAQQRWDWQVDPDHISIHIDAATAAAKLMRHYAGSDGRVIIMPPVYNRFYDWLDVGGVYPVEVPLTEVSQGGFFDLDGIETSLAAGTRVILLCNPHNPLGRVFSKEELSQLADLANQYNAVVISDEVHAPLVYPGVPYTPWLTVSDAARATGIALHTATKSWNFAGLKCGIAIRSSTGPWPADLDPNITLNDSGFWGILATEAAYRDSTVWLDVVREHFQSQSQHLSELVTTHLPGVTFHPPKASFLAWLDFRQTELAEDPADYFLREARVALNPGTRFGDVGAGYARLNFGTSMERLERIIQAMGSVWPPR